MSNKFNKVPEIIFACFLGIGILANAPAKASEKAPHFSIPGRHGQVSIAAHKGKVVYLDFWASWCGPCRKSFPWMNRIQKRYGKRGFVVVAINLDKDRSLAEQFLKDVPANFAIGYDPKGKVATAYQLKGMPSSFVIDKTGKIQVRHAGFHDSTPEKMELAIQSLLNK